MLINLSCNDFIDELASDSPAPGGGSVSALAGSMSAALVSMVARLTRGKEQFWPEQDELEDIVAKADDLKDELKDCVDRDTESFKQVMAAYRLPKITEEEKQTRIGAIQDGLKASVAVPLGVAESCLKVLRFVRIIVDKGNPNALSDSAVAALMAYAGLHGAVFNVEINLNSIKGEGFVAQTRVRTAEICREAEMLKNEVLDVVRVKLK